MKLRNFLINHDLYILVIIKLFFMNSIFHISRSLPILENSALSIYSYIPSYLILLYFSELLDIFLSKSLISFSSSIWKWSSLYFMMLIFSEHTMDFSSSKLDLKTLTFTEGGSLLSIDGLAISLIFKKF